MSTAAIQVSPDFGHSVGFAQRLAHLSSCICGALAVVGPASLRARSFETRELVSEIDRRDETVLRAGRDGGEGGKRTGAVENLQLLPIEDLVA